MVLVTRTVATWALTLLLIAGCSAPKSATLFNGDKKQIPVTIKGKAGDNVTASFVQALPCGTRVQILEDNSLESTVKISIEQGEFRGREATVARDAIRLTE